MSKLDSATHSFRLLEDFAAQKNPINAINPLIKLLVTIAYVSVISSFGRYDPGSILPMAFYPMMIFAFTSLDVGFFMRRVMFVLPLIMLIGIFNPIFDTHTFSIGNLYISSGWLTFCTVLIKGFLTILSALLLVGTTGITDIAAALRSIRLPRLFVLQILLTYRYISLLLQEASHLTLAYSLRSNGQKGVKYKAWGSLAGGLMLRTFDKAQTVYDAMLLRGFDGEYRVGTGYSLRLGDIVYLVCCVGFFFLARFVNLPQLIGTIVHSV